MAQRKDRPDKVVVNCEGRTMSVQEREAIRTRFWRAIGQIWARNADKDPDETLSDVTAVVEEVRQEHFAREPRAQGSH